MKLLLVEDHPKLRTNIRQYLSPKGIFVDEAITWVEALAQIERGGYDVIVLDLGLPLLDGKEVTREMRRNDNRTPVLILTSSNLLEDKIELLELWADDYLTKPFALEELYARIRAITRRAESPIESRVHKLGDIQIDFDRAVITHGKREVVLVNKELQILEYLIKKKGVIASKSELIEAIWGSTDEELFSQSTTLEAHISSIRKKLTKDIITTRRGIGYAIGRKSGA